MTEEEVAEVATAAAQEAANDAYAMQTANQQGSDAQSRYYALAHRCALSCGCAVRKNISMMQQWCPCASAGRGPKGLVRAAE